MLGDLLMEINGQMTSITVEPPVLEGSRVQVQIASEISGRVSGASLETHYVIIRPDGEAIQVLYPWGMGQATSPGTFTVKGCIIFSTVSSDLEWLNEVLGVWEGTWDLANREWHTSVYEWEYPE